MAVARVAAVDADNDGLQDAYEDENELDAGVPDMDGGGIIDGIELLNGTDPKVSSDDRDGVDSDGDGLTDSAENRLGTDSNNADGDRDKVADPWEVLWRLSPFDPDSNHDGILDWAQPGARQYKYVNATIRFN